jgi:galactokinase
MSADHLPSGDPAVTADHLVDRFVELNGRPPAACAMAPGRVNLIGEHVDYNDGRCLPMALPHATYAAVGRRDDDRVRVTSLQKTEPWTGALDTLGPGQVEGWATYVAGVVWALQQDGVEVPGLDIVVDSRVPVGSGLSSSAALECSVALAVCGLVGLTVDQEVRRRLVAVCMRAEAEVAGAPTGGMDQTVSLLAEAEHALLIDCQDWSTSQVPWDPAAEDLELLVVDTRAQHSLSDGGYQSRRRDCERAAQLLGVSSLREVDDAAAALAELDDDRLRRRTRHVLSEMVRVDLAVAQLERRDFTGLGETFDASHESLRHDFEVSCAELDVVVESARRTGALGARMTGGGFGGSAIALIPRSSADEVTRAVTEAFRDHGWGKPGFLLGRPSHGARPIG